MHRKSMLILLSKQNWVDTKYRKGTSIRQAPVFRHHGKVHGSLLSGWINYNYTACCWFPTSSNISILPSQFWQIRFESCWLHCSKCRILVLLRYVKIKGIYTLVCHSNLQGYSQSPTYNNHDNQRTALRSKSWPFRSVDYLLTYVLTQWL